MSTTIPPSHQPNMPGAPSPWPPPQPASPFPGSPSPGPSQPYPQSQQPGSPFPGMPSPYGPMPPAPPSRSRRGIVALVVVLAAIGIAAGVLLVNRDGGGESPEEALRGYFVATQSRDCAAIVDYFSGGFLADNGVDRAEMLDLCRQNLEVEDAEIQTVEVVDQTGDEASVQVTWTGEESGEVTEEFGLVHEDGRWLVDSVSQVD